MICEKKNLMLTFFGSVAQCLSQNHSGVSNFLSLVNIPITKFTLNRLLWTPLIKDNPELFGITCQINVNAFKKLLARYPNQVFVRFWPHAAVIPPRRGIQRYGMGHVGCLSQWEWVFLITQVETEVAVGRFSASFGCDLLPGMYSPPVHMVPKPETDTLRFIVDHSQASGEFSFNSMIICQDGCSSRWNPHITLISSTTLSTI